MRDVCFRAHAFGQFGKLFEDRVLGDEVYAAIGGALDNLANDAPDQPRPSEDEVFQPTLSASYRGCHPQCEPKAHFPLTLGLTHRRRRALRGEKISQLRALLARQWGKRIGRASTKRERSSTKSSELNSAYTAATKVIKHSLVPLSSFS